MTEYAAFGTVFAIDYDENASYVDVAQVRNISGPSLSMEPIDVTNHGSTSAWKEYVPGLLDGGEITLDLLYDPAGTTHKNSAGGLLYAMTSRDASLPCKITFPDTGLTSWTFNAVVTGFEPGAPHDGELSASVTLQITGVPTLA